MQEKGVLKREEAVVDLANIKAKASQQKTAEEARLA